MMSESLTGTERLDYDASTRSRDGRFAYGLASAALREQFGEAVMVSSDRPWHNQGFFFSTMGAPAGA
jgi:hypothetical protein